MALISNRYNLQKTIAMGGMAEIWLATQLGEGGFKRLCAVKRILAHYAQDAEFVQMFRDEAHISKRLQHANIVRVEGYEEIDGTPAIIMEFIDGADLRTLLAHCEKAGNRLSIPMIIFLGAEAARGLHYAHTKVDEITGRALNIIHRDISPQNILVSFEGEVKITDFGIAEADNKMTETKPGVIKGKYSYMSPEQISNKPIDASTDVFALGIVLWETLSMQRLFSGDNEVHTINLVRACQIPTTLRQQNTEVTHELEGIIRKALEKDRRNRYQSAEELEKALRTYLNKHHPQFSPGELGELLKDVLSNKRETMREEIKKALTSPRLQTKNALIKEKLQEGEPKYNQNISEIKLQSGRDVGTASHIKPMLTAANQVNRGFSGHSSPKFMSPNPSHKMSRSSRKRSKRSSSKSRHRKSASLFNMAGMFVFAAIVALAGLMGYSTWRQQAQSHGFASIRLSTDPSAVTLTLDNKPLFGGEFVSSPILIDKISPNRKHNLIISRDGYQSLKWTFEANPGAKIEKSNLSLNPRDNLITLKIIATHVGRGERPFINISGERNSGFLPLTVNDINFNQNYSLKVYPNYPNEKQKYFNCVIRSPSASKKTRELSLSINLKLQSCSLR